MEAQNHRSTGLCYDSGIAIFALHNYDESASDKNFQLNDVNRGKAVKSYISRIGSAKRTVVRMGPLLIKDIAE